MLIPTTKGASIAVHELGGDPDASPLLLCHATGFHARVWDAVAAALPGRRCLALDFRGYGDSPRPTDPDLQWPDFAQDLHDVLDALDLRCVQAAGHSMGGAALLMAEQDRPGSFERLVCFEPIMFPLPEGPTGPNPLAEITKHRREEFPSFEEAIERFAAKPPLGSLRRDVLEDYVRHGFAPTATGTIRLKADRDFEAQTYEMGSRHGRFDRLSEIHCPVLVIGSGDGAGPAAIAEPVARAMPHGVFRLEADLGHFGPLEDPARFATTIAEFFA